VNIIVLITLAVLGGANNAAEMERFGKRHSKWFYSMLGIANIPSRNTITRALHAIDPDELLHWLNYWRYGDIKNTEPRHIAIDGKEDNANQFYCLRALDVKNHAVIAYARVKKENNEISTAPALLNKIPLHNAIITGDAIITQRDIVRQIVDQDGNYVLALKGNHPQLYEDVKLYLDDIEQNKELAKTFSKYTTLEKGHGRIEKRVCIATSTIGWLYRRSQWKKLRSIIAIERTRTIKGITQIAKHYFISGMNVDAERFSSLIRAHWSIENQCHWHLDIHFDSDRSTISGYTAAINLAIFKDFALERLLNSDSNEPIKEQRIQNDHSFSRILKTLLNSHFYMR
jgi:predicted transposase YbfD/YdcC